MGVYEAKSTPSGLTRNIHQCLNDFDIPLYLSHTVTRVYGVDRLEGVEISTVDEKMTPIPGTQMRVDCDALILSVGLIPENEIAENLGVKLDRRTKGPLCDGQLMTSVPGIFSCGNALHVNDLVDYVSESGEQAGKSAALYTTKSTREVDIKASDKFLYIVPQKLNLNEDNSKTTVYFRSREVLSACTVKINANGKEVFKKKYAFLRPPEMEKLVVDFDSMNLTEKSEISFEIEVTAK